MDISTNNRFSFKSLNQPIKPFKIKTKNNIIKFKELEYKKKPSPEQYVDIFSFFLDNFAYQSSYPGWEKCRRGTIDFDKQFYINKLKQDIHNGQKMLKNPDTTILIGKNKEGKIIAGLISTPLNLSPFIKDNKTLYIDSIAVNKEYRGKNIGKRILKKVIDSTEDKYNDVFLVAYKESEGFYKKQGFQSLPSKHFNQGFAIGKLAQLREDYPQYAAFMNKPINQNEKRWYNKNLFINTLFDILCNKFKSLFR